jgi:hypothetical protein
MAEPSHHSRLFLIFSVGHGDPADWGVALHHLDTRIMVLIPSQAMDVCPHVAVSVGTFGRVGYSSKEYHQMSKWLGKSYVCEATEVFQGL